MVNELTTDENGTCTITGVDGEITITVTKEGYEEYSQEVNVSEDTSLNIILVEKDDEDLTDTLRNVKFKVQDEEESGIIGASINLVNSGDSSITYSSSNGGTGPRGGATIRDVGYGTYTATVTKEELTASFTIEVGASLNVTGETATVQSSANSETVVVTLN